MIKTVVSSRIISYSRALFSIIILLTSVEIISHGTVTNPPSRIWNCYQENPENPKSKPCIDAVANYGTQPLYDWASILQPNADNNHRGIIKDDNLASGGNPLKYGGMDQITEDWVATPVKPGPYTITWTITAPHDTLYYEVYITKANWTPNQPLTWDSLELLKRTGAMPPSSEDTIDVILPERTGKHVIYSIWQRSTSPEAFYSTSDIDFGNSLSIDEFDNEGFSAVLEQNTPNPFTENTSIKYSLKTKSLLSIKVYSINGVEISTLVEGSQNQGEHEIIFNSNNLSNGVYFYTFRIGNYMETRRMVIDR